MTRSRFRHAYCLPMMAVFLFAVGYSQQPREAAVRQESATVEQWKGEVKLQLPESTSAVPVTGLFLPKDTVIETGEGSMMLQLQDGSELLVKAHTRLVLRSPIDSHKQYLELMLGKIVAKVKKRVGNTPSFRMGTPTAVITVRGTRFAVEVNKKKRTIVDVYEGLVEVAGLGGEDRPILVEPGFSTQVELGELPELPREVMSPPEAAPDSSSGDQNQSQDPGMSQPPQP